MNTPQQKKSAPADAVPRIPRNSESYVATKVLSRDRPAPAFMLHETLAVTNNHLHHIQQIDNNIDHDDDGIINHHRHHEILPEGVPLPEGMLPEQYSSKKVLRPSERRQHVRIRTSGRGWSCPKHVCFRPLGEMKKTSNVNGPPKKNPNNPNNNKESGSGGSNEDVALRLQDAQAIFSGEEVNNRGNDKKPLTQLGHFKFKQWKPTFHNTSMPRHVDEALFQSLKRSKLRVNHAKVCGGGGSRIKNMQTEPPPIVLTQEDYDSAFSENNMMNKNDENTWEPTRPTPSSIHKYGHEVMSPRVTQLLRSGDMKAIKDETGIPSQIYLPYTSRHPRNFPLRLPNYKEYSRGGSIINDDHDHILHKKKKLSNGGNNGDGIVSNSDKEELKKKKIELAARRNFQKYYGEKYKDEEQRRRISKNFYRKLNAAPPRKKKTRSSRHHSTKLSRKARPPTPGLPRTKMNRPAERLHEVAQHFVTCRASADQQLLHSLDTIERERELTMKRKKGGMTSDSTGSNNSGGDSNGNGVVSNVNRPDWTWEDEIKSMRIVADLTVLEEMIQHAKKHVWYMTILKNMHENPNDPSKAEIFVVNVIHRILSYGLPFDSNCFLHVLCSLHIDEYKTKAMQDILHQLRVHSDVTLKQYSEWCRQLDLPESEEVHEHDIHAKRQLEVSMREHEVLEKKLHEHQHEKVLEKKIGEALSAF